MKQQEYKRIDNARVTLNAYIEHYENKIETMKGSGMKKQKGGNVIFFNKPKELIKKLDLIVGEISAGNTSIDMRNMGVSILVNYTNNISKFNVTSLYNATRDSFIIL